MSPKYPKVLKDNSKIGLICPAGGFQNYKPITKTIKYLDMQGYRVKTANSRPKSPYKYLSASDRYRASEFNKLVKDSAVDAIFCMRGGYGCTRILDELDYSAIAKSKKVIVGYSDITALLLAIYKKTGLISIHGPMFGNKLIDSKLKPNLKANINNLFSLLKSDKKDFEYSGKYRVIRIGSARGKLIGGNLTTICSLIGSDYLPDFKGAILFLEDCHEEAYVIDRLFRQLINSGILDEVAGIALGSFEGCKFKNKSEFYRLVSDATSSVNVPVMCDLPFGHGRVNYALPMGRQVCLDAKHKKLYAV